MENKIDIFKLLESKEDLGTLCDNLGLNEINKQIILHQQEMFKAVDKAIWGRY